MESASPVGIEIEGLNLWYGKQQALYNVDMNIFSKKVTALIGPSGCGKSTLIRCLNRMNDLIANCNLEGSIKLDGEEILEKNCDIIRLRRRVGMVFQKPNPFPFSIFDNVAYGPRMAGITDRDKLEDIVVTSLKKAALFDELRDRLTDKATEISGGQQQRLCIARALAMGPDVLLMDEPCSALDPLATCKIEELIDKLKQEYTVVIVTHNMQQALRVSDFTAFMYLGKMVEYGETRQIFSSPKQEGTLNYVNGRFG